MMITVILVLLSMPAESLLALTEPPAHVTYAWTSRATGTDQWLRGLAHGNGTIVVVGGGGTVRTSPDGISWTARGSGTTRNLMDVAYGASGFVAVGESGTILTSPDGQTWSQRSGTTTEGFHAVTYGNGRYVAVGENGTILSSPDGAVWTARVTGTTAKLYGVSYGARLFVAVGYGGTILTSPDGATWSARTSGTTRYLSDVAYGNDRFLIVGESDTVLSSADGLSWKPLTLDSKEQHGLWALAFGQGQFVAVGGVGNIVSSPDGASWNKHASSDFNFLDGIAYVNGQFVTVGAMGSIRTSGTTPLRPDTGAPGTTLPEPTLPPPLIPTQPEPVKPPQQPVVTPPPVGPKPVTTCAQGQVSGPRQERKMGALTILADGALTSAGGREEFCGNITINQYLKVDGSLVFDPGDGSRVMTLSGQGHVYVESPVPYLHGTLSLFTGRFDLDSDVTELLKQEGLDQLKIAGVTYKLERLQFVNGGVRAKGQIQLPPPWEKHPLKLENVEIIHGELNVKGEFTLPDVQVGTVKLTRLKASFDTKANTFIGQGRIVVENMLGIEGAIGIKDGKLDRIGIGVVGTSIALDSTGLFLTRIYGEVDGVSSWPPRSITASVDISGGPPVAGRTALKAKDATMEIDLSGKVSGSGKLVLFDKVQVADGEFRADLRKGFWMKGGINIEDAIIATVEISLMDPHFYGKGHGILAVPKSVRFIGGERLANQELTIDKQAIAGALNVGKFQVTCRKPWDSALDCSSNLKQLFGMAHEVRYLASAGLLVAAVPEHTFVMPDGVEQALIRLAWDTGDADFVLTAPDGTQITPTNAGPGGYVKRAEQLEAYYALENPKAGTWTYTVTARGAKQYGVEVFHVMAPPRLILGAPAQSASAGGPVTITWSAQAPAGSTVNLFYDETGTGHRGTMIAADLDAAAGQFTWSPGALPSGRYYIYASVDDGSNAPVYAYAPSPVTIQNAATPAAPTGLTGRSAGGRAELSWAPVTAGDVAGYRVYLKETGQSIALGSQISYAWAGLTPGRSYTFTVSAYRSDGLEGAQSAPVTLYLTPPSPPRLTVDWPQFAVTNQAALTISGQVEAGATGAIYLDETLVRSGLAGTFRETVTLRPGPNQVWVTAAKPGGDGAEQSAQYFLDSTPPQLSVQNIWDGMTVNGGSVTVTGQVEPGARLTLNGRAVTVTADGTFAALLPLSTGANAVALVARDQAGNETAFRGTVNAAGGGPTACGQRFPDVPASHPACKAIEQLAALGVINGYADGTFLPNKGVTRAEFAKMLVLTLGRQPEPSKALPFTDARQHWAATQGYLQVAYGMGAINGFDAVTFKPDDPITRAQVVKIAAASAELVPEGRPIYADVKAQDWYAGWVTVAHRSSLIGVRAPTPIWFDTFFAGDTPATRAEAAILLTNLLSRQ